MRSSGWRIGYGSDVMLVDRRWFRTPNYERGRLHGERAPWIIVEAAAFPEFRSLSVYVGLISSASAGYVS